MLVQTVRCFPGFGVPKLWEWGFCELDCYTLDTNAQPVKSTQLLLQVSQQLLQAGAPRARMGPHSDRTVADDHLSLTVHQGPRPKVDKHLARLRGAEVKLRIVPAPAVPERHKRSRHPTGSS